MLPPKRPGFSPCRVASLLVRRSWPSQFASGDTEMKAEKPRAVLV